MNHRKQPFLLIVIALSVMAPVHSQNVVESETTKQSVINASDFESLQAAFDALPEQGGVVQLSVESVEIRQPIVVRAGDVLVRGSGPASHIQNANTDGRPAFIFSSEKPHPKQKGKLEAIWRVQLSDFRLTGNDKSGHGIDARFVNEIFVDGVTISEHGGNGVHLHMCYEDPRVNDSLLTYNKGAGVYAIGCHDAVVSGCHFEENADAIRFVDGFNLTATGNNIDDHLQHGVVIANSMGNTVSSNMIEQCVGIGVVLERDTYGTTVSSNVFTNDREGGVSLSDAHGCTITGNTFSRVPKQAVAIDDKSHATTISGNTFAESSVGEGKYKGGWDKNVATGIVLDGASLVNITGNTFSNLATQALTLAGEPARDVIFSSNILLNTASDHDKLVDSVVQGNLERSIPAWRASEKATTASTDQPPAALQPNQLRIATCQFPVSGNISENADWIRRQMREARDKHANVVHFSEVAFSGYAGVDRPNMSDYDWDLHDREFQSILNLAKQLKLWVVLGSAHRLIDSHKPHNSLYVINDSGEVIDRYDKRFCTGGDLKYYSPGDHFVTFEVGKVRCGLLICYDIRFPELYRQYSKAGTQVIFHSFHNARQKPGSIHPKIMPPTAQARAATNGMFLSVNNSSAARSWPSIFVTPDGLIESRLETDQPGVMVNTVDTSRKYYDASRAYRQQSIAGVWNSGETVDDPRSRNRQSY